MGYKMNGIPQLGGGEDAKKKLNTPYDSLKAGVGRKYYRLDAYGKELFDRPMKLNEARYTLPKMHARGEDAYTYGGLDRWGNIYAQREMNRRDMVAVITKDDKDGFYWYGKHHSIPKKRKPTPKMDKIPTKDIAKGKKVQAKVKNPPKPKVKRTLYTAASQLAKQGKPIGYTETKLPGASKVLRSNISAKEYKKK